MLRWKNIPFWKLVRKDGKIIADTVPKQLINYLGQRASTDPYFARYIKDSIEKRANRKRYFGASVQLVFQNGKYLPQQSALQI